MKRATVLALAFVLFISGCSKVVKEITTTISGRVTNEDEPVTGAYVILLDAGDSVNEGLSLSNGMITNSHGDYMIVGVSPGNYYVAAIADINSNLAFNEDTDKIGYWGEPDTLTGLTIPSTLHINEDDDLEGINITKLYGLR